MATMNQMMQSKISSLDEGYPVLRTDSCSRGWSGRCPCTVSRSGQDPWMSVWGPYAVTVWSRRQRVYWPGPRVTLPAGVADVGGSLLAAADWVVGSVAWGAFLSISAGNTSDWYTIRRRRLRRRRRKYLRVPDAAVSKTAGDWIGE